MQTKVTADPQLQNDGAMLKQNESSKGKTSAHVKDANSNNRKKP